MTNTKKINKNKSTGPTSILRRTAVDFGATGQGQIAVVLKGVIENSCSVITIDCRSVRLCVRNGGNSKWLLLFDNETDDDNVVWTKKLSQVWPLDFFFFDFFYYSIFCFGTYFYLWPFQNNAGLFLDFWNFILETVNIVVGYNLHRNYVYTFYNKKWSFVVKSLIHIAWNSFTVCVTFAIAIYIYCFVFFFFVIYLFKRRYRDYIVQIM